MMVPEDLQLPPPTTTMSTTSDVAPIPTVIPGVPLFQDLGDTGMRTLWYLLSQDEYTRYLTRSGWSPC